jgi:hypothetical protein
MNSPEILQPAAVDRLRVAIEALVPAVVRLTMAVNALYEQERVRTWGEGLVLSQEKPDGGPPLETFAPLVEEDAYTPVKAAILAYAAKHGQKAAQAVLARFNVKSGLDLPPGQYRQALQAFAL